MSLLRKNSFYKNLFNIYQSTHVLYDRFLLWLTLCLVSIGLIMVASSSMLIAFRLFSDPLYFVKRNVLYILLSFILSLGILRVPIPVWYRYSFLILFCSLIMLLMLLLTGYPINGSLRWISLGYLCVQPAELSKLSLFFYLSSYLSRIIKDNHCHFYTFYKPIIVMLSVSFLILMQPDFGSVIIIVITTLLILFIAGMRLFQFFLFFFINILILIMLVIFEPYRIQRIISFWNPWLDPFGSGYQLTQSLVAFGRGEIFGQGLGNSIQKMEYLPESHTDFIFSIISEELGYFGTLLILCMIFLIIFRGLSISYQSFKTNQYFSGFLSCSIAIWLTLQTVINIGVTTGLLPTKGLTLPLISYGGSSFMVIFFAIMLLLRIDFELRIAGSQAFVNKKL